MTGHQPAVIRLQFVGLQFIAPLQAGAMSLGFVGSVAFVPLDTAKIGRALLTNVYLV